MGSIWLFLVYFLPMSDHKQLAWPNTKCHLCSVDLNDTNSILISMWLDIGLEFDVVANLVIDVYLVSIGNKMAKFGK